MATAESLWINRFILLFIFTMSRAQNCQERNQAAALAEDSTRVCRKSCSDDSDCGGDLKTCNCDDLCGLSCFNPSAPCPDLTLTNGTISLSNGNNYNSVATHQCTRGYYLAGERQRKCRSNKKWSHSNSVPYCTQGCLPPTNNLGKSFITSGRLYHQVGYPVGSVVTYKCNTGYDGVGNADRTCQSNHLWTSLALTCSPKNCGAPSDLYNGYFEIDKQVFGGTLRYKCNKGYNIEGRTTVYRCMAEGVWEPREPMPRCEPVRCIPPTAPENGGRTGGTSKRYGDDVDYYCNPGYVLNGLNKGVCNENGTWGVKPTCNVTVNATFGAVTLDGYTITDGSSWTRTRVNDFDGLPGYSLRGDGTVQSLPFPLSGDKRTCMQARVKDTEENELKAVATYNGTSKDLHTFSATNVWKLENFWLQTADPAQTKVRLQFVAPAGSYVLLDDIKTLPDSECDFLVETTRPSSHLGSVPASHLGSVPASHWGSVPASTPESVPASTSGLMPSSSLGVVTSSTTAPTSKATELYWRLNVMIIIVILVLMVLIILLIIWRALIYQRSEHPRPRIICDTWIIRCIQQERKIYRCSDLPCSQIICCNPQERRIDRFSDSASPAERRVMMQERNKLTSDLCPVDEQNIALNNTSV